MKLIILVLLLEYISNKLLSVIEINRHGARTSKYYPKISENLYGSGKMQLTINGYRQEQLLGEFSKNKYIKELNFLSPEFNRDQIEIYTSQTERTIFSAAGFLSSFYPNYKVRMNYDDSEAVRIDDSIPIANFKLKIKEIPINVVSRKNDTLFHALDCQYKGTNFHDLKANDTVFAVTKEDLKKACTELKAYMNIKEEDDVYDMEDSKKIEVLTEFLFSYSYHYKNKLRAKKISEETQTVVKKEKINKWYSLRLNDSKFLRLSVSNMLDNINDYFKNAKESYESNNENYKKFVLYSGHDSNIVNLLSNILEANTLKNFIDKALDDEKIFNFLIPPFASNLFFELHYDVDSKKYYVKIIYNGNHIGKDVKYIENKNVLENKIDYGDFLLLMEKIIDKDYKSLEC